MNAINCTAAQDLPMEAHLNDTDHDTERGALYEDYRLMFGHNPTTSNLPVIPNPCGAPVLYYT